MMTSELTPATISSVPIFCCLSFVMVFSGIRKSQSSVLLQRQGRVPFFMVLLWQDTTGARLAALAVFLLGSGPIGFDRALFRPAERLERTEPGAKRRTSFDRQPTDTP